MKATIDGAPITIDNQTVQVYFNYGEMPVANGRDAGRAVECIIRPFPKTKEEQPTPFATGIAVCSPKDNFNKSKGRLLAWKRAVQGENGASRFSREQRQDLWAWFTSTCRLPDNTSL